MNFPGEIEPAVDEWGGMAQNEGEEMAGKRAKCPKCSHINQIPDAEPSLLDEGLGEIDDTEYKLAPEEMLELLFQMQTSRYFSHCPHGRPVIKVFTKREIERWFHRV